MKKIPILILTVVLFLLPTVFIYGQGFNYVPLSGITAPDGKELLGGSSTLPDAFGSLYKFGIGIVFTLAFLSFIYAGWEYIGTDIITKKAAGKDRLWATTIGVLIAISGFALLNTINPDILAFQNLDLSLENPSKNSFLDDLFKDNKEIPLTQPQKNEVGKKIFNSIKTTDYEEIILVKEEFESEDYYYFYKESIERHYENLKITALDTSVWKQINGANIRISYDNPKVGQFILSLNGTPIRKISPTDLRTLISRDCIDNYCNEKLDTIVFYEEQIYYFTYMLNKKTLEKEMFPPSS